MRTRTSRCPSRLPRGLAAILALGPLGCAPSSNGDPLPGPTVDAAISPDADDSDARPAVSEEDSCERIDLLFVIDSSLSMEEEQTNLGVAFPGFIEVVEAYRTPAGNPLDYHVGVTTTDCTWYEDLFFYTDTHAGDDGALRQVCGGSRRWLETGDTDVSASFACTATVGIEGSYFEMPLQALHYALADRVSDGTNAGFFREDALLAVVIITDEDDCTRTTAAPTDPTCEATTDARPISETLAFLDQVTGDRGRWAAAIIAGESDCSSDLGEASEAVRLKEFAASAGANTVFTSICAGDLATSLASALTTFEEACAAFPPIL